MGFVRQNLEPPRRRTCRTHETTPVPQIAVSPPRRVETSTPYVDVGERSSPTARAASTPAEGLAPILFSLVVQTMAFRGLPPSGSVGRRHKPIVCPTGTLSSELYWVLHEMRSQETTSNGLSALWALSVKTWNRRAGERAALTRRRRYPRSPCRPLAASKHRRLMSMLASAARLPTAPPPPDRPSSHSAADPAAPAPPPDRTTVHPPSSPDTHRNPPYS